MRARNDRAPRRRPRRISQEKRESLSLKAVKLRAVGGVGRETFVVAVRLRARAVGSGPGRTGSKGTYFNTLKSTSCLIFSHAPMPCFCTASRKACSSVASQYPLNAICGPFPDGLAGLGLDFIVAVVWCRAPHLPGWRDRGAH
jgi:hypothetical protein